MSSGGRGDAATRRALAEWVAYLRDIGVRDLAAAAPRPAGERAAPAPARPSAPPAKEPARRASRPELFSLADSAAGGPSDPVARLREIREEIGDCRRCRLHERRTQVVFGVGNPSAGLMFVGEGPGAEEDARGEPFVGRAGKKLDEMIRSVGLERGDVYIANVVKCRPPDNRTPEADEASTCSPFLFAQIEAIRPRVIVALGAPAAKTLLGSRLGITQIRGTWGSFRGIPVMPTFHPAYLLRAYTQENRRKVWEDLKAARLKLDEGP